LALGLLPRLGISRESVKYYASLVGYYSVYKLNRMDAWQVYLYLLCFALHRAQRLNDNLINSLLYHVRHFRDEAKAVARERLLDGYQKASQELEKAGQVLRLFTADGIPAETPFHKVQETAFSILGRDELSEVADRIAGQPGPDEQALQWEHIDLLAPRFKRQLRPILQAVCFASPRQDDPLLEAVAFLKAVFRQGRALGACAPDSLPAGVIPKTMRRYLCRQAEEGGDKQVIANRYEFWVYRLMRNALEAGDLFCRDSVRFRSFEDDLLDDRQWQHKQRLLEEAGLAAFKQPAGEHLAGLEQQLEARIAEVNRRIAAGENGHLQFKQQGRRRLWSLKYPPPVETANHSIFDALAPANIASVLDCVNRHCPFLDAFEHVLGRFAGQPLDERALIAALLAWGTNLGLGRTGEISDMGYPRLAGTSDNRIRLETLREANDRISNGTAKLPVFPRYTLGAGVHSSSDGQKFEARRDTLNARHSPKYFGLQKGIVSYTLVANHVPVSAEVIGANEHESHYVFDLLHNNAADIEISAHSTDTHGANQVNFAILHLFGYQFAPRYRDIYTVATQSLYGFRHPSHYTEAVIKPVRKVNTDLIVSEWDNIQRIMASLAQKTTTQSIIIGKLSAHARKNRTKRALWEYDNIIKSLYLLDYIDSPPLRQNVQKALNRGESYHKLRRAIAYANFGKLRFKTEREQQIWNECSRLLANCIIYYNASLISGLLACWEQAGDQDGAAMLARVSPVAWSHINLFGRYEFGKPVDPIDLERVILELARMPAPRHSSSEGME
jgi:TnpA family transposase